MPIMLRRYSFLHCTLALLTGAALVVSMSACDSLGELGGDEDDPDVGLGHFTLTLEGDATENLEGTAVFATSTVQDTSGEEQEVFALALMPDSADVEGNSAPAFLSQFMRASERPETGNYTVADVEEIDPNHLPAEHFAFSFVQENETQTVIVASDTGTIEVTSSSSSRFAGRFSVEASGLTYVYSESDEPHEGTVTIEGEFNAIGGPVPNLEE